DISSAVKSWQKHADPLLSYLSYGLINRRLFRLEFSNEPFAESYLEKIRAQLRNHRDLPRGAENFLISGEESNSAYTLNKEEIMVLSKTGKVVPMSQISDFGIAPRTFRKYFLCFPKEISGL
ncbi:MAG: phosphohydrolase, partial [Bacteroidota bacterium]